MAIDMKLAERLFVALKAWPNDGKPDRHGIDPDTTSDLVLAGYVERRETKTPCKLCGVPQFDHAWLHITGGGRLFMVAMEARAAQGDA